MTGEAGCSVRVGVVETVFQLAGIAGALCYASRVLGQIAGALCLVESQVKSQVLCALCLVLC